MFKSRFTNIKFILSPERRRRIRYFLSTNDARVFEDRYMYKRLDDFFTLGEEKKRQEMGETSFNFILKQTCLLFGYKPDEFLSLITTTTFHEFLLQKLETSHPNYLSTNMDKHEEHWLQNLVCDEQKCDFCKKSQTIMKTMMAKQMERNPTIVMEENGHTIFHLNNEYIFNH